MNSSSFQLSTAPNRYPPDCPLWPLSYVSAAFSPNKLAGELFVPGLILNLKLAFCLHYTGSQPQSGSWHNILGDNSRHPCRARSKVKGTRATRRATE
jgi:hypothetical protein